MKDKTSKRIYDKEKEIARINAIEALMRETMTKARELNCAISVNSHTGRMEWQKYEDN